MEEPIDEILFGSEMNNSLNESEIQNKQEDNIVPLTEVEKNNLKTKENFYRDQNELLMEIGRDYGFIQ